MSVKSGGRVYLSRDTNTPVISDSSAVQNAGKRLLIVACRMWHNVSNDIRLVFSFFPRKKWLHERYFEIAVYRVVQKAGPVHIFACIF